MDKFSVSIIVAALAAPTAFAGVWVDVGTLSGGIKMGPGGGPFEYGELQVAPDNTNGAPIDLDDTDLDPGPGVASWSTLFGDQGQFGLKASMILSGQSPASYPSYQAREWGGTYVPPAVGSHRWLLNNYAFGDPNTISPSGLERIATHSHLRSDGSNPEFTLTPTGIEPAGPPVFALSAILESDDLFYWYTLGVPNTPQANFLLTGRYRLTGVVVQDPQDLTWLSIDSMTLQAEAVPEPMTLALAALSLAAAARMRRRKS